MKDFLKYTMASCLGVFLAGAVFFFLFFAIIAGIIASTGGGGGKTTITTGSVLALDFTQYMPCLLYTSPSPRDRTRYRMPSSA